MQCFFIGFFFNFGLQILNVLYFVIDNCMSDPDGIATVLEAFTYVCSEGEMRDWLGKEGSVFWFELLSLLSSRPLESPTSASSRYFFSLTFLQKTKIT